jgi:hypothetical protein
MDTVACITQGRKGLTIAGPNPSLTMEQMDAALCVSMTMRRMMPALRNIWSICCRQLSVADGLTKDCP